MKEDLLLNVVVDEVAINKYIIYVEKLTLYFSLKLCYILDVVVDVDVEVVEVPLQVKIDKTIKQVIVVYIYLWYYWLM